MAEIKDNWYLILGLEFDPAEENEAKIEERIVEKKKFWDRNSTDFQHPEYRLYSQHVADIRKEMIGPANRRAEFIKDAKKRTYDPVLRALRQVGLTEITADMASRLAKSKKTSVHVVEKCCKSLGIAILQGAVKEEPTGDAAIMTEYVTTRPEKYSSFSGETTNLDAFGAADLYEFLSQGSSVKYSEKSSCGELSTRAAEKKKAEFNLHNAQSGIGSKLCARCEDTFKDKASKEEYDVFLRYIRRVAVLEEFKGDFDWSQKTTPETCEKAVDRLTDVEHDRDLAEKIFKAFCSVKGIPLTVPSAPVQMQGKKCRCGHRTESGKICKNCGLPLEITCPKCKAVNENTANYCGCGFYLGGLEEARNCCKTALVFVKTLNFGAAEAKLADAARLWPGLPEIKTVRERLEEMKRRIGYDGEKLRTYCREKRYFAAESLYRSIQSSFPEYADTAMEEEIKKAVKTAEEYVRKAKTASSEKDAMFFCVKAQEAAADCPGTEEMMRRYPVTAPTGLLARPVSGGNHLTWNGQEGTVLFAVVCKEGSRPSSLSDGMLLTETSECSYTHKSPVPGKAYYYAVFSKRGSTCSAPALTLKPIIASLPGLTLRNRMEVNNRCFIRLDLPEGATGVLVLCNRDKYASAAGEAGERRLVFSKNQILSNDGIYVEPFEKGETKMSLFAEYKTGTDTLYSAPSNISVSKGEKTILTYSVSRHKIPFGKSSFTITFKADGGKFELPDLEILSGIGAPPLFREGTTCLQKIEGCTVNGSYSVTVPLGNLPSGSFVKPFFAKEESTARYQLQAAAGANLKIS